MNPIQSINGRSYPPPAVGGYKVEWDDASRSSAGRTEDFVMHPEKAGTARKYTITYKAVPFAQASAILKGIDYLYTSQETFSATLLDVALGEAANDYFVTSNFYVGNRTADTYSCNDDLQLIDSISFSLISVGVN